MRQVYLPPISRAYLLELPTLVEMDAIHFFCLSVIFCRFPAFWVPKRVVQVALIDSWLLRPAFAY